MSDDSSNETNSTARWSRREGKRHAHFDCFSGAAGDMMLSACLDAVGEDGPALLNHIQHCIEEGLPDLKGQFSLEMRKVLRSEMGSIAANYVTVKSQFNHAPAPVPIGDSAADQPGNHNRTHEHYQNHEHSHEHTDEHIHSHSHSHCHEQEAKVILNDNDAQPTLSHGHNHHRDSGPLRNLPQIRQMLLDASPSYIPVWVRDYAIQAFTELAKAEAMTHGASSLDTVHFHEVGAVDSIVDTVGTLLALYFLDVCSVSCSRLPIGEGTVWTDHGLLPVPAPATMRLLIGMPLCPGPLGVTGELVTPTAAALLRVLTKSYTSKFPGRPPCMTLCLLGIGAGTKDFAKHPNILRVLIGESVLSK
jgi:uncharacterized protein (DUF111 family)